MDPPRRRREASATALAANDEKMPISHADHQLLWTLRIIPKKKPKHCAQPQGRRRKKHTVELNTTKQKVHLVEIDN